MGDTSKTLWVEIGCYGGCRWDAMDIVVDTKTLRVEIGYYEGCRWDAMGRTKTLCLVGLTHLRHCGWR